MKNFLLFIIMVCSVTMLTAQTQTSATYTAADIPTAAGAFDMTCNGPVFPLDINIPAGDFVFSVDVAYDITAQGGAWMSEQRSQIFCQDTGNDEGGDFNGTGGNSAGTESYSRTGLIFANGVDADGVLTFELRAWRTWPGGSACDMQYQFIPTGTWTVVVNHGPPPTCLPTSDLAVANATGSTLDVSWTENGTATTWDIEVVPAGTAPTGTATYEDVPTNPFTISSLVVGGSYDIYVRADCDSDNTNASVWEGPVFFFNDYCTPGPVSVDNNGMTNVAMGTINNATGAGDGAGSFYSDYTSLVTDAPQGLPLAIDITYETGFTYDTWAWVDWNNDLDFGDADEANYLGNSANTNPTTLSGSITVPLTASLGNHRIRIGGADFGLGTTPPSDPCFTGNFSEYEDYTLNVIAPPNCLPVTTVVLSGLTATSVDVAWTAGGPETVWDIEVVEAGNAPTGTPTYDDIANPFTVSGLNSTTTYTIYVRGDCAMDNTTDVSIWTSSGSFLTPCIAITTFPACEDFATAGIPNCWEMTGPAVWEFNTNAAYGAAVADDHTLGGATNYAWMDGSDAAPGNLYELITPQYDISLLTNPYLAYWVFSNNIDNPGDNNTLYVEMNDGTAWVPVETITGDNPNWIEYGVDVNAAGGVTGNIVQFKFIFESTAATDDFFNDILIDDVCMNEAPSCPTPSSLVASAITATTADMDFNYSGAGTEFIVEYGPIGFIPGTGAGIEITVNTPPPFTITGLPSSSDLQIFVKEVCAPGDESDYAGPATIQTACVAISTFPACEEFPAGIPNCWSVTGPATWEFSTNAAYGAAAAQDHTAGGGTNYAWMDGSDAAPGNLYELLTPLYDVTSLNAPYLSYWVYTNNVDNPGDNNTLTVELWDGANWVVAETIQGDNENWIEYTVDVNQIATVTGDIQFKFVFQSTTAGAGDDFFNDILIDDVCLKELPLNDIGVTEMMAPTSGCGLGLEDISVEISNLGFNTQGGFFVGYSVNGVVQTALPDGFISNNIVSGATEAYTFTTQYDFSTFGTYTVKAWTELAGDSDATNDTTTVIINNIPVINTLPFFEDFETSNGGFVATNEALFGATVVWEWGTPAGAVIDAANSGTNAWVTNLVGNYDNSTLTYLIAPCMDFSDLSVDPELSFALRINSETNFDGAWVEVSIDGGDNWALLGTDADPGWYNNADQQFQGDNTAWTTVTHSIDGVAGESSVRLRFGFSSDGSVNGFEGAGIDDINIIDVCAAGLSLSASGTDESVEQTSADGTATVVTGNPDTYTYLWSSGGTTDVETGLMAGTYTVTVTASSGCKDEVEVVIGAVCAANIIDGITYLEEGQNSVTSDGSITVTATSTNPPYTFDWADSENNMITQTTDPNGTSTLTGLTAGLYYVTVSDAGGCPSMDSIVVTAACPVNLGSTITGTNETTAGSADGSATVTPTVGVAPYDFVWSTGGDTDTEADLSAGVHTVTITDAAGCTEIISVTLDFSCPASLGASATGINETLEGANDGAATATVADGTPPYQFEWDNGETGNTVLDLAPGTYDVTVTDANGCIDQTSVTIDASNVNVGIEDIEALSSLAIAPNPTTGQTVMSVRFTENVDMEVEIISIVGQVITKEYYNQTASEDIVINLSDMPSGIYFVKLNVNGAIYTERIVKR
jgi:hypothetical protein